MLVMNTQTPFLMNPCRCKARAWKPSMLYSLPLPRCMKRSMPGTDFCRQHAKHLPYGRCDNPLEPRVLAKIAASLKRKPRKTASRWYCRYFMFKQAQENWGLENVIDMTDEQCTQALDAVHEHLGYNAPQRVAWKLQPNLGPEDVTERDTPKALYAGAPVRYKNYSYRLLCFSCHNSSLEPRL